jgi:hypothetical protein
MSATLAVYLVWPFTCHCCSFLLLPHPTTIRSCLRLSDGGTLPTNTVTLTLCINYCSHCPRPLAGSSQQRQSEHYCSKTHHRYPQEVNQPHRLHVGTHLTPCPCHTQSPCPRDPSKEAARLPACGCLMIVSSSRSSSTGLRLGQGSDGIDQGVSKADGCCGLSQSLVCHTLNPQALHHR